jgi:hypothetical protein
MLREQPIIGRVVELEDRREVLIVVGDGYEDAVIGRDVMRRDEAMGIELADE